MERVFSVTTKSTGLRERIVFAFVAVFCLNAIVAVSVIGTEGWFYTFNDVLKWVVYAVFLIDISISLIKKELIATKLFCIMLTFSIVYWIFTGMSGCYIICLFLGIFSRYGYKKLLKFILTTIELSFLIILLLTFFEIIPHWIYLRDVGKYRYSLGFTYPTATSGRLLFIICLQVYLSKSSISYLRILLYALANLLLYNLTDARTAFLLINVVLIVCIFCKIFKKFNITKIFEIKAVQVFCCLIPIFVTLLSIVLSVFYNPDIFILDKLNAFFSGRLQLAHDAFNKYGVNLFGQHITWYGWGGYGYQAISENFVYNYVDNAYWKALFDRGVVGLLIILIIYTIGIYRSVKDRDYWCFFMLVLCLIQGIIDDFLLGYNAGNYFIFLMSTVVLKPVKTYSYVNENAIFEIRGAYGKFK